MLLTPFIILISVSSFLLLLGYGILEKGRSAAQIGGFIVLLVTAISVLSSGIDYYNGETTVTEAGGNTSITESTSTNTIINTGVGLILLLISILGFFMGIEKAGDEADTPY
jgi:hypothetical protein